MSAVLASRAARVRDAAWLFARLAAPYWSGQGHWRARGATILLVALTAAQVGLVIGISYWNRRFFDALEARSLHELLRQIGVFALILGLTMTVTALHLHIKRWIMLDWRRWLTRRLVGQWMSQAHHYQLQFTKGEHDNPDQRIAEDVRIATELAVSLAHSLLYSLLIGFSFFDILLDVSGSAPLPGTDLMVPAYMVLLAFLYAGTGTVLGFLLGRPLVRTTNRLQTVEANLRFNLAQAREHSESIALMRGEALERRDASRLFGDVAQGFNRQTVAYLGIVSFSTAYGNLLPVFPLLVTAPQYVAGAITLGVLMQTVQAFQQFTSALSWPIDHLGEIATWRASAGRVVSLHRDMEALEPEDDREAGEGIRFFRTTRGDLEIRSLRLAEPAGKPLLDDFSLRVRRGERVLIHGDADVTLALFKAMAGLWPWGSGEIGLPNGHDLTFMPQHPYLPHGTLRAVLCYPYAADAFPAASLDRALECAGLAWLAPRLEDTDDWSHALPLRARQRLGLARIFLQQPAWVFLEEALDGFDRKGKAGMLDTLHRELPNLTLLAISRQPDDERFFDRVVVLPRAGQPDETPVLAET